MTPFDRIVLSYMKKEDIGDLLLIEFMQAVQYKNTTVTQVGKECFTF